MTFALINFLTYFVGNLSTGKKPKFKLWSADSPFSSFLTIVKCDNWPNELRTITIRENVIKTKVATPCLRKVLSSALVL